MHSLLVLDPCVRSPELEAHALVRALVDELSRASNGAFPFREVIVHAPNLSLAAAAGGSDSPESLEEIFRVRSIGACISLGSLANLTEGLPWFDRLATVFRRELFDRGRPLFGICFTHQLVADMFGYECGFLRARHAVPFRKHHIWRESRVLHPKLALLQTPFCESDYFSGNGLDLAFRDFVRTTRAFDAPDWERAAGERDERLTPPERRVRALARRVPETYTIHCRHEQEVLGLRAGVRAPSERQDAGPSRDLIRAATSPACAFEAFVHARLPVFTVQGHPETMPSDSGRRLLKNFLYYSALFLDATQKGEDAARRLP